VINENENLQEKSRTPGFEVLIRRIAEGSDSAVWELLDRYSTNILRVVRRHLAPELRSKLDSVDIVQSVWRSFLRKGEAFDNIQSAEQFVGYIAGIARNKVLETHRHFTKYAQFDIRREVPFQQEFERDADAGDRPATDRIDPRCNDPSEIARARENWGFAMDRAGERGQRIIQLRLQGMTYDEIAEETGLSAITVRRTLASVLVSLTA
jgi:RNA polymerase sigma factor (sigma-70 family)